MKVYLAILGFLREPDDAFVHDYFVVAKDVKMAKELVQKESDGRHHMFFEVGCTPTCWEGYAVEVTFGDSYTSETPLMPTTWLKGVVTSGLIHDISLLEQEDREALYEHFATKLMRGGLEGLEGGEYFRYGPYELRIRVVDDWENLLRLKLTEIEKK